MLDCRLTRNEDCASRHCDPERAEGEAISRIENAQRQRSVALALPRPRPCAALFSAETTNPMPSSFTYLLLLLVFALLFHGLLWARNARFLWGRRGVILKVVLVAEAWMLLTDPLGGRWGAWFFDAHQTLGLW